MIDKIGESAILEIGSNIIRRKYKFCGKFPYFEKMTAQDIINNKSFILFRKKNPSIYFCVMLLYKKPELIIELNDLEVNKNGNKKSIKEE